MYKMRQVDTLHIVKDSLKVNNNTLLCVPFKDVVARFTQEKSNSRGLALHTRTGLAATWLGLQDLLGQSSVKCHYIFNFSFLPGKNPPFSLKRRSRPSALIDRGASVSPVGLFIELSASLPYGRVRSHKGAGVSLPGRSNGRDCRFKIWA